MKDRASDRPGPASDREEPPFVEGLVTHGMALFEQGVRTAILALGRRTMLFIWGAGTVTVFLGVLALSVAQQPSAIGVLKGIGAGFVTALLFALPMGWTLLWAFGSPKSKFAVDTSTVSELDTLLAPVLRELNAVRVDVIRQVKARSVTRVPLGVAAAFVLWAFAQSTDDPPGVLLLPLWLLIGAVAGETWAAHKLDKDYRRLYKSRVLPHLAARVGDLTYRPASADDVQKLRAHRVFGEVDRVKADDEIVGTYRGLPLSIVETRLERRSGDDTVVVFNGLLIQLTLPRALTGTTAVIADEGRFGNFKAQWRTSTLEPVRLEDPQFEKRYEVYGTDQIEARALLTPAFIERFMRLASRSGFSLPGALAEANRLIVALPKNDGRDLFEPPVYWKRAGGRALHDLSDDIRAVLNMADAVIDLDFWARGRKDVISCGRVPSRQGPAPPSTSVSRD